MFNLLPNDIISYIFLNNDFKPYELLLLKNINHQFKSIIKEYNGLYNNQEISYDENKIMNEICLKNTSINDFLWLFNNNYEFSLGNIKNLIQCNRYNIIKLGLEYTNFKQIIYNRFYIYSTHDFFNENTNNIKEYENPIIIAGLYNRIEILKLIIDNQIKKTTYPSFEITLLDLAIKYNHKNLLNYLIINHYDKIEKVISSKIKYIICRIENCEDSLFYLILNKKININHKFLEYCIQMNYIDLFNYLYSKIETINNLSLIKVCIENSNYNIFNRLINKYSLSSESFTNLLIIQKKCSIPFLNNINNNYSNLLDKKKRIIQFYINNDMDNNTIIELIKNGHFYDNHEMKQVLERENLIILKEMINNYNI